MGYDFMLMQVHGAGKRTFPIPADAMSDDDFAGSLPWNEFKQWLISRGGRENGSSDSIWVEYAADLSSINYGGNAASVYMDVHADWEHVEEAFSHMAGLEPECVLFDPQSGDFHDITSFRCFRTGSDEDS